MSFRHSHRRSFLTALVAGLAIHLSLATAAFGADLEQAAKNLIQSKGEAIVTVRTVVQMGVESGAGEVTSEIPCPVFSPEGLILVPISIIDPGATVKQLAGPAMALMMGDTTTRLRQLDLIEDGEEKPAEVVLRDPDLQIAVIRPKEKPAKPMVAIDAKDAADPGLLATVITLSRLGKVGSRLNNVASGEIEAVLTKPRKFYVLHGGFLGFGAPVFTPEGKLVGVTTWRNSPALASDLEHGLLALNASAMGLMLTVLPASDIANMVDQAAQIKKAEPLAEDEPTTPAAAPETVFGAED